MQDASDHTDNNRTSHRYPLPPLEQHHPQAPPLRPLKKLASGESTSTNGHTHNSHTHSNHTRTSQHKDHRRKNREKGVDDDGPYPLRMVVLIQAYVRGWRVRREYKRTVRRKRHRDKVVAEVLATEETYYKSLNIMSTIYVKPIQFQRVHPSQGLLADGIAELAEMVAKIDYIININMTLLDDLRARVANWGDTQIVGDIFLKLAPYLKLYTLYTNNYDKICSILAKAAKDKNELWHFILSCKADRGDHLSLDSFLIMPIQRIPRYTLLLEDLVSNTWADHRDYELLCEALKALQDVAEYINESIANADAIDKVLAIQNKLGGEILLVEPHRVWVKDGTLMAFGSFFNYTVWVYLFNDCLVFATRLLNYYRFAANFHLATTSVISLPDIPAFQNVIRIKSRGQGPYILIASSQEEKMAWLNSLKHTINTYQSRASRELKQNGEIKPRLSTPAQLTPPTTPAPVPLDKDRPSPPVTAPSGIPRDRSGSNSPSLLHSSEEAVTPCDQHLALQMIIEGCLDAPHSNRNLTTPDGAFVKASNSGIDNSNDNKKEKLPESFLSESEQSQAPIRLSFSEQKRLYDLGVVDRKPTKTSEQEAHMRQEVGKELAFIQKGILERQQQLQSAAQSATHSSRAQTHVVHERQAQLAQLRNSIDIRASRAKVLSELVFLAPAEQLERTRSMSLHPSDGPPVVLARPGHMSMMLPSPSHQDSNRPTMKQTASETQLRRNSLAVTRCASDTPTPPRGKSPHAISRTPRSQEVYAPRNGKRPPPLEPPSLSTTTTSRSQEVVSTRAHVEPPEPAAVRSSVTSSPLPSTEATATTTITPPTPAPTPSTPLLVNGSDGDPHGSFKYHVPKTKVTVSPAGDYNPGSPSDAIRCCTLI
eukprot:TRINITY_DN4870_c0_g1_i1.p1 TRINITY_DN4870_c0_g1~~TRINITY_DN4870_c0_g1_i1.p1  ORF type:complete len:879 (+),score=134.78 TRINITY_DN4870_c0_g1_i1:193-2829(+)